jgi:competence transcription factor ComK
MTLHQAECNWIAAIFNKKHAALAYADSTVTLSQSKDIHVWKGLLIKLELNRKKIGLTASYEKTKIIKLMTQNLTLKINNHIFAIAD